MEALDLYFRYAASTLLLIQAGLLLRDHRDLLGARLFAPFAVAQTFELLRHTPFIEIWPVPIDHAMNIASRQIPILIWWFTMALFEDDFRLRRRDLTIAAIWFVLAVVDKYAYAPGTPLTFGITVIQEIISTGIAGFVAWRIYRGFRSDLLERRRRLRLFFAAGILVIFLTDIATDLLLGDRWTALWFDILFNGLIFALALAGYFWLLRVDRAALRFEPSPAKVNAPPPPDLTPAERVLKSRLDAAMAEKIYLEADLSIGALAARLGAPEHQVRALINRALGHRNFRAFLNEQRLAAAKADLADPEKARIPILTIAMDAGFASLAPFNRAFREATGETPSAWRAKALDENA